MSRRLIRGSIGAGLFVGSGGALRTGGPASLLLGFGIVYFMLLCTMQALGELAVMFPGNGPFYTTSFASSIPPGFRCRLGLRHWLVD